ncbi:MAG: hypothetical protein K2G32_07420, partial [Oscillospiraceae bacterium]|nr:hypothetical protein [Oscillospiraceae bacterium]
MSRTENKAVPIFVGTAFECICGVKWKRIALEVIRSGGTPPKKYYVAIRGLAAPDTPELNFAAMP